VLPLLHIVLIDVFFLFLRVVTKKMRNSTKSVLRKAKGMFSKEGKRYNEI